MNIEIETHMAQIESIKKTAEKIRLVNATAEHAQLLFTIFTGSQTLTVPLFTGELSIGLYSMHGVTQLCFNISSSINNFQKV